MDNNLIELITRLHKQVLQQQELLTTQKRQLQALQTGQFIMMGLLLEYDPNLRRYLVTALSNAISAPTIQQDPYLKVHFQEMLRLAEESGSKNPL